MKTYQIFDGEGHEYGQTTRETAVLALSAAAQSHDVELGAFDCDDIDPEDGARCVLAAKPDGSWRWLVSGETFAGFTGR